MPEKKIDLRTVGFEVTFIKRSASLFLIGGDVDPFDP